MIKLTESNNKIPDKLVLLDFYSPTCPPCRQLAESLKQFEKTIKNDNLQIGTVNIDKNKTLDEKYDIEYLPTLVLCLNGIELDRKEGRMTVKEIQDFITNALQIFKSNSLD